MRSYISMKEYKLYRLITYLFFPPFVAAAEVLIFSPFSKNIFGSLIVGLFFLTIYPTLLIYKKYLAGKVDIDVSERAARPEIYSVVLGSILTSAFVFWLIKDNLMFTASLSYAIVTAAMFFLNRFSKVSTHTAGLAGPITAVVFYFGIFYAGLYILLFPVAYARFKLGMHNRLQLALGAIVGIALTYATFSLVL